MKYLVLYWIGMFAGAIISKFTGEHYDLTLASINFAAWVLSIAATDIIEEIKKGRKKE